MLARLLRSLCFVLILASGASALDVPSVVQVYEPVLINHEPGTKVQVLPWGLAVPEYLDERHIVRFEKATVFSARPGAYLVVGDGQLAIVVIRDASPPGPSPPNPPGPQPPAPPGPNPPSPDDTVPPDRFKDIGRLARSSLSLVTAEDRAKHQTAIKAVYIRTAEVMRSPRNGVLTLNDGLAFLQDEFAKVFGASGKGSWDAWARVLNDHIAKQDVDRKGLPDLCDAIAKGL